MEVKAFFDERTYTLTYIVWDETTKDGVLIDSVLDYDPIGSRIWTDSMKQHVDFIRDHSIHLHYILETHAHADHLSASPFLKKIFPQAKIGIGSRIVEVQQVFKEVFSLPDLIPNGSQFDILLQDGEELQAGCLKVKVLHTPGHTPACVSYLIGDALFTGDALFMPDYGVGRCDFPKGDPRALYKSIQEKIYTLPDNTRVFVGHDYMPEGRPLKYESTIGEEKKFNIHLPASRSEEEFVKIRTERDKTLAAPKLLYQSVMVNICGGGIPKASENSRPYFKLPVNIQDRYGLLHQGS